DKLVTGVQTCALPISFRDAVGHQPAREIQEEVLLGEIEDAVVVPARLAAGAIPDLDCVVTEALPDFLAGTERYQRDLEIRAGLLRGSRCGRRGLSIAASQHG